MKQVNSVDMVRLEDSEIIRITGEDETFHVVRIGKLSECVVVGRTGGEIFEFVGSFDGAYWPGLIAAGDAFWVSKGVNDVATLTGKVLKIEIITDRVTADTLRESALCPAC